MNITSRLYNKNSQWLICGYHAWPFVLIPLSNYQTQAVINDLGLSLSKIYGDEHHREPFIKWLKFPSLNYLEHVMPKMITQIINKLSQWLPIMHKGHACAQIYASNAKVWSPHFKTLQNVDAKSEYYC